MPTDKYLHDEESDDHDDHDNFYNDNHDYGDNNADYNEFYDDVAYFETTVMNMMLRMEHIIKDNDNNLDECGKNYEWPWNESHW